VLHIVGGGAHGEAAPARRGQRVPRVPRDRGAGFDDAGVDGAPHRRATLSRRGAADDAGAAGDTHRTPHGAHVHADAAAFPLAAPLPTQHRGPALARRHQTLLRHQQSGKKAKLKKRRILIK